MILRWSAKVRLWRYWNLWLEYRAAGIWVVMWHGKGGRGCALGDASRTSVGRELTERLKWVFGRWPWPSRRREAVAVTVTVTGACSRLVMGLKGVGHGTVWSRITLSPPRLMECVHSLCFRSSIACRISATYLQRNTPLTLPGGLFYPPVPCF